MKEKIWRDQNESRISDKSECEKKGQKEERKKEEKRKTSPSMWKIINRTESFHHEIMEILILEIICSVIFVSMIFRDNWNEISDIHLMETESVTIKNPK